MDSSEEPDDEECDWDGECGADGVCENGECVSALCESDADCSEGSPVCDQETGECVECVDLSDCSDREYCRRNQCARYDQDKCSRPGEKCDPDFESGEGFACVPNGTEGPICMRTCGPDGDAECASQQVCAPASSSADAPNVCYTSQCEGPADFDGCQGYDSYANGAKCQPVGNGVSICVPAGESKAGEPCTASTRGACQAGEPCAACAAGNTCVEGVCKPICTADSDCGGDAERCIGEGTGLLGSRRAGFCEEPCPAFSRGECSDSGEGCAALTNDLGYCRPTGSKQVMEACEPAPELKPEQRQCGEGMDCILFQEADAEHGRSAVHRCVRRCHPPSESDDDRTDNDATCGGEGYIRFFRATQDPASIDIYVDGVRKVDDLTVGEVSDADDSTAGSQFFSLRAGERDIDLVAATDSDNSNPLFSYTLTVTAGRVATMSPYLLQAVEVPRQVAPPASGSAKVRVVQQIPDISLAGNNAEVDVVAVESGDGLGAAVELATALGVGSAGGFVEVDGNKTYDLYAFDKGAKRTQANTLVKLTGVSLPADSRSSLFLRGTTDSSDQEEVGVGRVPYTSAPVGPEYRCWTGDDQPAPASGFCFQKCAPEDYGEGKCQGTDNACSDRFGPSQCLPTGGKQEGQSCDPFAFEDCGGGSDCATFGDGSGVCRSECLGGGSSNPSLECGMSTSCAADPGEVGRCRVACQPDGSYADTSCPNNQQSCYPVQQSGGTVEGAWCTASGTKKKGQECGGSQSDVLLQNCQAGLFCSYRRAEGTRFAGSFLRRSGGMEPTCRTSCEPFADKPGCPGGMACMPELLTTGGSLEAGVCLKKAPSADEPHTGADCDEEDVGMMCGEASYCLNTSRGAVCVELCDLTTGDNSTCSDGATCGTEILGGSFNGVIGACNAN